MRVYSKLLTLVVCLLLASACVSSSRVDREGFSLPEISNAKSVLSDVERWELSDEGEWRNLTGDNYGGGNIEELSIHELKRDSTKSLILWKYQDVTYKYPEINREASYHESALYSSIPDSTIRRVFSGNIRLGESRVVKMGNKYGGYVSGIKDNISIEDVKIRISKKRRDELISTIEEIKSITIMPVDTREGRKMRFEIQKGYPSSEPEKQKLDRAYFEVEYGEFKKFFMSSIRR